MSTSNDMKTPEGKENFLQSLMKLLKNLFSAKRNNQPFNIPDKKTINNGKLGLNKFSNEIAQELIEDHSAIFELTKDFIGNNEDRLASLLEKNRLNDAKEMVKSELLPNVEAYFESKELSDGVASNPMRRVEEYRHKIFDDVNAVISEENDGVSDLLKQTTKNLDTKLSEPSMSHNESLEKSPRHEMSKEISKETIREMTADVPEIPM